MTGKRALWSEEALVSALRYAAKHNNQREASRRFGIPRRTLRNHLLTGSFKKKLGKTPVFNTTQEKELVRRIIKLANIGLPVTSKFIRHQAYRFAEINELKHNFNKKTKVAGRDWLNSFRRRNPEISIRKAQFMNQARAQKLNKFIVNDYFNKLKRIMEDLDIKHSPERIYNVDEKGCRLTLHHQQNVLAQKGSKRVHIIANEHAENVTIVSCVSALGQCIPPMIIFKGQRIRPEWKDNMPAGTLVTMAQKGSMTSTLFIDFIKHLSKYKTAGPILLIMDGAKCHLDISIVEEAEKCEIHLFCLPSNTTHELQPLDKSVFRSFESNWDQEILSFWDRNKDRTINKARFGKIFTNVWHKCMSSGNIVNGFAATGIYPFNPEAIPEFAFAPSLVSERPNDNAANDVNLTPIVLSNISGTSVHINYDDEQFDSEDDLPLIRLMQKQSPSKTHNTSFQDLIPTPILRQKSTKKPRKKALNYKAQEITKNLFETQLTIAQESIYIENSVIQKPGNLQPSTYQVQQDPSTSNNSNLSTKIIFNEKDWFCHVCQKHEIRHMRQCIKCTIWAHEECIGFCSDDEEDYLCAACGN